MNSDNFIKQLINYAMSISAGDIIQFILACLAFLYIFFGFALWRQVSLMSSVVEIGDTTILKILSLVHFLAAIIVFLLTFILL